MVGTKINALFVVSSPSGPDLAELVAPPGRKLAASPGRGEPS